MIMLADKIIMLRKKAGWSQEELAEKLNVTRQSVSKWEGNQSIPDLDKILKLSEIFEVSTDYLLKDTASASEGEISAVSAPAEQKEETLRSVSAAEAKTFFAGKVRVAKVYATAVFLCVISPITLIFLGGISEMASGFPLSENAAGALGLCVLLVLVAIAVMMFIWGGSQGKVFKYLEEEPFILAPEALDLFKEKYNDYQKTYTVMLIVATSLCILAVLPLLLVAILSGDDLMLVFMVDILLLCVAVACILFVYFGSIQSAFHILMQKEEYTVAAKRRAPLIRTVGPFYWSLVTAIFLAYSFITDDWSRGWIIWAVAGVLYAAVAQVCRYLDRKKAEKMQ